MRKLRVWCNSSKQKQFELEKKQSSVSLPKRNLFHCKRIFLIFEIGHFQQGIVSRKKGKLLSSHCYLNNYLRFKQEVAQSIFRLHI